MFVFFFFLYKEIRGTTSKSIDSYMNNINNPITIVSFLPFIPFILLLLCLVSLVEKIIIILIIFYVFIVCIDFYFIPEQYNIGYVEENIDAGEKLKEIFLKMIIEIDKKI